MRSCGNNFSIHRLRMVRSNSEVPGTMAMDLESYVCTKCNNRNDQKHNKKNECSQHLFDLLVILK